MIYLDNNATTKPIPSVIKKVSEVLSNNFGNASSTAYALGRSSRKIIDEARSNLAELIDCDPIEIVFTSGGTESIYFAILGAAIAAKENKKIQISNVEHPAVVEAKNLICNIFGFTSSEISLNKKGQLDYSTIQSDLDCLTSVMMANNETGVINPTAEIFSKISKSGFFHVDTVQAIGKIPFSFSKLGISSLSISAHKFGGPKGVGALIIKNNSPWKPFFTGGGQELGRRGGTENVPLIAGLGEAAKAAKLRLEGGEAERLKKIRDHFEGIILNELRDITIVGQEVLRLPNTSCLLVGGTIGFEIVEELGKQDICISSGSACKSGTCEPSRVLTSMGYSGAESIGALRISFGFTNTIEESEKAAKILIRTVKEKQEQSRIELERIIDAQ